MISPEASTALYDSSMVVDDEVSDQEHAGPAAFALLGKPDTSDEAANLEALPALLTVNSGSESLGKDIIAAGDACLLIMAAKSMMFDESSQQHSIGLVDMALPSKKTPLQVIIERFIRAQLVAAGAKSVKRKYLKCKCLIMTTHETYVLVRTFLKENAYFGADKNNFHVFVQGLMPQVDLDGKIILSEPSQIQMSATGSGAIFESICNDTKVKNFLSATKYLQVVGILAPSATIFP